MRIRWITPLLFVLLATCLASATGASAKSGGEDSGGDASAAIKAMQAADKFDHAAAGKRAKASDLYADALELRVEAQDTCLGTDEGDDSGDEESEDPGGSESRGAGDGDQGQPGDEGEDGSDEEQAQEDACADLEQADELDAKAAKLESAANRASKRAAAQRTKALPALKEAGQDDAHAALTKAMKLHAKAAKVRGKAAATRDDSMNGDGVDEELADKAASLDEQAAKLEGKADAQDTKALKLAAS